MQIKLLHYLAKQTLGAKLGIFMALCTVIISVIIAVAYHNQNNHQSRFIHYYESAAYHQAFSAKIREANYYLQFRLTQNNRSHHKRKLAIVMDIDDTALSHYDSLHQANFQITPAIIQKMAWHTVPAIPYTLALYNYAKDHGIAVFFVTGRSTTLRQHTISNLNSVGFHAWEQIFFYPDTDTEDITSYRIAKRRAIQKAGYDIIMNIGNRSATLVGGYADITLKLPNPFTNVFFSKLQL